MLPKEERKRPIRLEVKVVAGSSKNLIQKDGSRLKAYVSAPAQKGRANKALMILLSQYLKINRNHLHIVKGKHARLKIIEIQREE